MAGRGWAGTLRIGIVGSGRWALGGWEAEYGCGEKDTGDGTSDWRGDEGHVRGDGTSDWRGDDGHVRGDGTSDWRGDDGHVRGDLQVRGEGQVNGDGSKDPGE